MHSDLYHKRFEARFSDGKTAGSHEVTAELTARGIAITTETGAAPLIWPYGALATSEPLSQHAIDALVTYSHQPGATLFVPGPRFARSLAELAPGLTTRAERWRTVTPWLWGTAALVALSVLVWMANLSPARTIATMLPDSIRETMGRQVVRSMSNNRKVCNDPQGSTALKDLTAKLSQATASDTDFNVTVIDWGLVNAFATPGENIVLTRGLLESAQGPDEVAAVLAHEMGHGLEMHPETGLVRAMGLSAALELMMGGSGGTLGNAGLLLLQLSYSREAEREADDHALRILKEASISPKGFASFFERMHKKSGGHEGGLGSGLGDMLSTHPQTDERLSKTLAQGHYPSKPSLSDAQWEALQAICASSEKLQ
ncbi:MAG: M48 family metallopeptidase [Alphaproteobacteria bacterium]|nr:M48 family metallopeptidase [Alphaproteobacteria bacterium]